MIDALHVAFSQEKALNFSDYDYIFFLDTSFWNYVVFNFQVKIDYFMMNQYYKCCNAAEF